LNGNFNEFMAADNEDATNIWYQWNFTPCAFKLGGTLDNPNLISNRPLIISEWVILSVGNVHFEAKTFIIYRSKNTNFSIYSSQVSIDEQRRAENAFDRVKKKE